jgi:hypothetical protein
VYYFLAQGTIDDIIWPMLQQKMSLLGEVMEGITSHEMLDSESEVMDSVIDDNFLSDIEGYIDVPIVIDVRFNYIYTQFWFRR